MVVPQMTPTDGCMFRCTDIDRDGRLDPAFSHRRDLAGRVTALMTVEKRSLSTLDDEYLAPFASNITVPVTGFVIADRTVNLSCTHRQNDLVALDP